MSTPVPVRAFALPVSAPDQSDHDHALRDCVAKLARERVNKAPVCVNEDSGPGHHPPPSFIPTWWPGPPPTAEFHPDLVARATTHRRVSSRPGGPGHHPSPSFIRPGGPGHHPPPSFIPTWWARATTHRQVSELGPIWWTSSEANRGCSWRSGSNTLFEFSRAAASWHAIRTRCSRTSQQSDAVDAQQANDRPTGARLRRRIG